MLTIEKVKSIMLEELAHKGYAPNPADVLPAAAKIVALSQEDVEEALKGVTEDKVQPSLPSLVIPTGLVTPPKV